MTQTIAQIDDLDKLADYFDAFFADFPGGAEIDNIYFRFTYDLPDGEVEERGEKISIHKNMANPNLAGPSLEYDTHFKHGKYRPGENTAEVRGENAPEVIKETQKYLKGLGIDQLTDFEVDFEGTHQLEAEEILQKIL